MNAPLNTRVLRSYQQRAATYLYETNAGFLVAPLGAGKGAAALTAFADLVRDGHRRHALVIAPKLVATTVWPLLALHPAAAGHGICSTAARAWHGCRQAGRPSSPNRQSHASIGLGRRGT